MSRPPHVETEDDGLAVDYVLGELAGEEARAFEERLARDPDLAREVERLRGALGLLPYAKATEPPAHLRAAVLRAADEARRPRAQRRPAWSTWGLAAAAALVLALGIDGYRLRRELRLQRTVSAMLQEPNVVVSFALRGTGGGSGAFGAVKLDLDAKKGALVVERLPPLAAGHVYRLWAAVGANDVPCGDFRASADGGIADQFAVPVDSYTAPISRLFLTVEPMPPPSRPSGPTVMTSA
jgi:anti-sigma-K factor RskA